jgi:hypothetical protein
MSTDLANIIVENILLLDCKVEFLGPKESQSYCLAMTKLQRTLMNDSKTLLVRAEFDLMHGVKDPACGLKCTFLAVYSNAKASTINWEEFTDGLAVAHMIPFVREFIANITNRMPVPPLLIRPVNAYVLVEDFQRREAVKAQSEKPSLVQGLAEASK